MEKDFFDQFKKEEDRILREKVTQMEELPLPELIHSNESFGQLFSVIEVKERTNRSHKMSLLAMKSDPTTAFLVWNSHSHGNQGRVEFRVSLNDGEMESIPAYREIVDRIKDEEDSIRTVKYGGKRTLSVLSEFEVSEFSTPCLCGCCALDGVEPFLTTDGKEFSGKAVNEARKTNPDLYESYIKWESGIKEIMREDIIDECEKKGIKRLIARHPDTLLKGGGEDLFETLDVEKDSDVIRTATGSIGRRAEVHAFVGR